MTFNKVIIWGHKLGTPDQSHTHSFVHEAFYRTFKNLGYETYWLDNNDRLDNLVFNDCLFISEGQVDSNIPVNKTNKYVLHNCNLKKYNSVISNVLNLQVYTHDCLSRDVNVVDKDQLCYYQPKADYSRKDHGCDNRTLYQPWATNLLPHEFSSAQTIASKYNRIKKIYWIGSVMYGEFRNDDKLMELQNAAAKDGVELVHAKFPNQVQPRAIAESWIAPALQGNWQINKGYIPCRVFKNLSFGRMTPTNSAAVNNLFNGQLVYSESVQEMYEKAAGWESVPNKVLLADLVNLTSQKHTYINRIENILKAL